MVGQERSISQANETVNQDTLVSASNVEIANSRPINIPVPGDYYSDPQNIRLIEDKARQISQGKY